MVRQETGNRNNKTIHRITLVLTSCLAFVLLFACSAFAAENNAGAAKNPNATYFPKTISGKTSRELFKEGVYFRQNVPGIVQGGRVPALCR